MSRKLTWTFAVVALVVLTGGVVTAKSVSAQSIQNPLPATPARTPQWQTDAGGKRAFDIASVKPNRSSDSAASNFPLGPGDAFVPNGGLFAASNQPLVVYLTFAYKLRESDLLGLPAWANNERFDVEARTEGKPSKDQMRLMMQSLLAGRFKLATHTATKQGPVFALILSKSGRTGPQLQRNAKPCSPTNAPQAPVALRTPTPSAPSSTSGLQLPPFPCGNIGPLPASAPDRGRLGGRGVTLERIAAFLKNPYTGLDRPVLDRTGLTGTFDFSLEWSLAPDPTQPPNSQSEDNGPTLLEALQDQLGLKLKSRTGPVEILVIDHIEEPSPN
jgi:uncharacterized protein (TIGR03435 family)